MTAHSKRLHRGVLATGLAAGLMAGSAQGAILSYQIDTGLGGAGFGSFSFDDSVIDWVDIINIPPDHTNGGTVALSDFLSFNWDLNGSIFDLGDVTGGQGAWIYSLNPLGPDFFAGLELSLDNGADTLVFTPGFGLDPNDFGTVEANGSGLVFLDNTNTQQIPEPETWLGSLLAIAIGFVARRRRGSNIATRPA